MPRVALWRVGPVIRIKAKEKLDILGVVSAGISANSRGYTNSCNICQRTVHVSQKEISKFNRV